jgi:Fe-S-cluster containining protein
LNWPDPVAAAYAELLQQLDAWFGEVSDRHPGVIPCRTGCSACCHGPFDISVADAVLIREAMARLPANERMEVERRALAQALRMQELEPGWEVKVGLAGITEAAFDRVSDAMANEPCPLLDDQGACRIYQDRPLVCRLIGLGVVTPGGRVIENACPIASQFPEYEALPLQPFDLEAMEELETACLEAASDQLFGRPDRSDFETTIAAAITEFCATR